MSRHTTWLFTDADERAIRDGIRNLRAGAGHYKVGRDPYAALLIDISRAGGVGDLLTDNEVVEAYKMIDQDRGENRRVRVDLLERLLRRWRNLKYA